MTAQVVAQISLARSGVQSMIEAQVTLNSQGALCLAGIMDYRSGPSLRQAGQSLIRQATGTEPLIIDCAAIQKSSSVGIALVLAFMRDAKAKGRAVSIVNLPEDMRHIAEVSGLLELLPIAA